MELKVSKWNPDSGEIVKNGLIRVNPNKPEYGSLMLINRTYTIVNGFANPKNKVGFITGKVDDLQKMVDQFHLREGDDFSQKVAPHRIVTLEKTESELGDDLGYREKINPSTGETLTHGGEVIYRKTEVVSEGSDIVDRYLTHDTAESESEAAVTAAKAEFQQA